MIPTMYASPPAVFSITHPRSLAEGQPWGLGDWLGDGPRKNVSMAFETSSKDRRGARCRNGKTPMRRL
jgi:hypothetical protein